MIFSVTWAEPAQNQLASVWLDSADREGVVTSSHRIDQILSEDPDTVGRRHYDNLRRFRAPPLAVEFEVNEQDRIVTVLAVWDLTAADG